jgi:hypothetical protein
MLDVVDEPFLIVCAPFSIEVLAFLKQRGPHALLIGGHS